MRSVKDWLPVAGRQAMWGVWPGGNGLKEISEKENGACRRRDSTMTAASYASGRSFRVERTILGAARTPRS
ncbi:MAG: hypothetical protein JSU73_00830 [candidate division WOR-3 bacterium]|nr:MAG: hypothetical protein JSU73_00830 [candidate division WOR-3 bacterium]